MPESTVLQQLSTALTAELLKRVKSGEASSADLAVARAVLRDNNISALPQADPNLLSLAQTLPFDPEKKEAV